MSPDNRLVLTSRVLTFANESCKPSYEWSLLSGDIDLLQPEVRTTSLFSPNLVIRPNVLVQGQDYVFELRVTCASGSSGTSRIALLVREPPRGGIFTVSPTSGFSLYTYFLLKAIGWLDSSDEFPLKYSYRIKSGQTEIQLSSSISDNQLRTTVPALQLNVSDSMYEAYVVVCDLGQSCVDSKTVPIQVLNNGNEAKYSEYLDSFIRSAANTGNSEGVVVNSLNLLYLMQQQGIAPTRRASTTWQSNVEYTMDILKILNNTYYQTAGSYTFITFISAPILQASIMDDPTLTEVHLFAMSIISGLVNGSDALEIIQDVAAENLFDAMSGIVQKMRKDVSKVDALFNNTLLLVEDSALRLGSTMLIGHVPYENTLELTSSEILLVLKRLAREQMDLIPTISSPNCFEGTCTSLQLSPSIPGITIDIHLLVWNGIFHPLLKGTSISNQTSVQVTENRLLRNIPYVQIPVQISLPILGISDSVAENVPTCRFWALESHGWSSRGCMGYMDSANVLVCSCFHLTDFSAILFPTRQPDLPNYGKLSLSPFRNTSQYSLIPFMIVSSIVFLAFWAALYGYILDAYALKRRSPALKRSLFERGYLHSEVLKSGARSSSLFFELWKRKMVQLFATQHGIMCLFWNHPSEMIDRPAKFSCLFVYVLSTLILNVILFEQVGFLDQQFLSVGLLTGFALIPVYPILSGIFKVSLRTKRKDKKSAKKRHGNKVFTQEPKIRKPRIEVAANIESFDNGKKLEPMDSTGENLPPRRKEAQASLKSLTIPGIPERRGIRTPEEFAISRPKASTTSIQALSGALQRPPSLPPIRSAFESQVAEREEGNQPKREAKKRKRTSRRSALPRRFYYLLYVPVVTIYALSIFTSLVIGSSMQEVTVKAWIYATVVSLLFEFLIAEPAWLCSVAFIYARARILQATQVMNRHRLNPRIFAEDVHARVEPTQQSPEKQEQELTRAEEDRGFEHAPSLSPVEAKSSPDRFSPSLSGFDESLGRVVQSLLNRSENGTITYEFFEAALTENDLSIDSTSAKSLWKKFASEKVDVAHVSDLIQALSSRQSDQLLFRLFSSCMNMDIRQCLLNDLKQKLSGFMPEVYISTLLKDIDFDGDGYVSYDEVRTGYSSLLWFIQTSNEGESESEIDARVLDQLKSAVDRIG
uniref:GPS domain-containing protein n=1 Tax=Guillardia theta TaxID=55529 RepID=A0A6U5ZX52_GUITH|mmetsp:Transcript_28758/g.92797  ORF Transcript_28758/g.92797 Transcript_28758/m.92797 type:complete len:1158 (+) Transcript_28758:591-4064(+)